jgi:hypothetical protein
LRDDADRDGGGAVLAHADIAEGMVLQLQHAVPAWFEVLLAVEDKSERADDGDIVDQELAEGVGIITPFGVGPALAKFQDLIACHVRTPFLIGFIADAGCGRWKALLPGVVRA